MIKIKITVLSYGDKYNEYYYYNINGSNDIIFKPNFYKIIDINNSFHFFPTDKTIIETIG